jgi:hypothetical protein
VLYLCFGVKRCWMQSLLSSEPLAKRREETGMQGASERGSEAYTGYVELSSERQRRSPVPQ